MTLRKDYCTWSMPRITAWLIDLKSGKNWWSQRSIGQTFIIMIVRRRTLIKSQYPSSLDAHGAVHKKLKNNITSSKNNIIQDQNLKLSKLPAQAVRVQMALHVFRERLVFKATLISLITDRLRVPSGSFIPKVRASMWKRTPPPRSLVGWHSTAWLLLQYEWNYHQQHL